LSTKAKKTTTQIMTSTLKGWWMIPKTTYITFTHARAAQAAAGLAYYAFLSLFPLLLLIIVGGSYFLDRQQVYGNVTRFFHQALPVSQDWIEEILQQVLRIRGRVGLISILTLLWSASGFFTNLVYNIDLAWPEVRQRNYLEKRLIGVGMVIALTGLMAFSMVFDWVANLIPLSSLSLSSADELDLVRVFSGLISFFSSFVLFLALYRWVPKANSPFRAAFYAGLAAAVLWKVVTETFNWFIRSGLVNYQLVYGSLGAIITFLLLIYLISLIILFGAHLCAAIDLYEEMKFRKSSKRRPEPPPEILVKTEIL
jgi:membrane protein